MSASTRIDNSSNCASVTTEGACVSGQSPLLRFWKCDNFPNVFLVAHEHDHPDLSRVRLPACGGVPYANASMKYPNRFLTSSGVIFKNTSKTFLLDIPLVNSDTPTTDFIAVADEIVVLTLDVPRIRVQQGQGLICASGEQVVEGFITILILVPFKQRIIDNPQEIVLGFINKVELLCEV